ncbi:TolC family protein [Limnohabitans sp. TS-CS-82]|uniref:TolC family protein n=1 Tax=Limnohabitans sp. TS-CS-82 TaxID=2094193 RepID=UPI0011AFF955|nr:TolC family protein [Limnohabitans sp. TS-CS-82]
MTLLKQLPKLRLVVGLSCLALIGAVQAAEPVAASSQASPAPKLILNPTSFAQLLLMRSLEIEYSRYSKEVAERIFAAESALYESVMYGNYRKTDTQRQRTTEEKKITVLNQTDPVLIENAKSVETGIKQLLPTGAEVTIGARIVERANNIMAPVVSEINSALIVTVKQPLLKGAGVTVTEADKRVAEYESLITAWQSRQQLLKVLSEGLSLYWQAHMAHQVAGLRHEMFRTAEALVADARQRVLAGKLPPRSIQELDRFRLTRQADWVRYQQNANELQSRLLTQLNYRRIDITGVELQPHAFEPRVQASADGSDVVDYALDNWAPFQVSRLKVAQARTRLAYAANQRLPSLDLQYSYSSNGLAEAFRTSASLVKQNTYPDWWVGFNFEMPLLGNEKAKAQFQAQNLRVAQAETELSAVRLSLENDLFSKRSEIDSTRKEVAIYQSDVQLKTALRKSEQLRFEAGLGLVSGLIQSDQDLLEAQIRLLDAKGRLEIARLALSLADGTLLETHHVEAVLPPTTLQ